MDIEDYFLFLDEKLAKALNIAKKARSKGYDPHERVEIDIAKDLADRVESLIKIDGIANEIRNLEKDMIREEVAFKIAKELVNRIEPLEKGINLAIRTAVAILTEGVVAAPIDGIADIKIDKNDDGSRYIRLYYAGPIRSAGGSAQALSVVIADYIRKEVGLSRYIPREEEIKRCLEEVVLYKRVAHLQRMPPPEYIRRIVLNCPVCIDGEPTEKVEVSSNRNLKRVETNRLRGGMILVISEGIYLKAPKIKKYVEKMNLDGWDWIDGLINNKNTSQIEDLQDLNQGFTTNQNNKDDSENVIKEDAFLSEIIAGRPVFSYSNAKGSFCLRYGRSRNSGFATIGINPATMFVFQEMIAPGTQMKIDIPGKAAGIVPVNSIEGPTIRLINGDVIKINTVEEAKNSLGHINEILDNGEILINYGDFLENNHLLLPSTYCKEWWLLELEEKLSQIDDLTDDIQKTFVKITGRDAVKLSKRFNLPLHPDFTYNWNDILVDDYKRLIDAVKKSGSFDNERDVLNIKDISIKKILEDLLVLHKVKNDTIEIEDATPFIYSLGLPHIFDIHLINPQNEQQFEENNEESINEKNTLLLVNKRSGLIIREKSPTRIGSRMGRPEKSKERKMSPPTHVIFPLGHNHNNRRTIQNAAKKRIIKVEIGLRVCKNCGRRTMFNFCECGGRTEIIDDDTKNITEIDLDIDRLYRSALRRVNESEKIEVKGVKGLISKNKIPEPIEKGILRAKHDVYVFRDGTIRYDLTNLPLTHFKPREIGISVDKIKELGYSMDYEGNPIVSDKQIIELLPQDIIVSEDCGDYIVKVADYIDDLLEKFYDMPSFYNIKDKKEIIGELVIGLAPHTSAGVVGRIIGFIRSPVCYAHPFFHAAKRRNCDGDEDSITLLLDGLINFSREFLPKSRGGLMDSPLVITKKINPKEIDSEVHNIDICDKYPLELYLKASKFGDPKDIVIERVSDRLNSDNPYQNFRFTHSVGDISAGPLMSSYKVLKKMRDKMEVQLDIAKKTRAVNENDVAERILKSHFIPDIMGNLRVFSTQNFRCAKCNKNFRRPPLSKNCPVCNGNIILTVYKASIKKYLEDSCNILRRFKISRYTSQRIYLLKLEIDSLFKNDASKIEDFNMHTEMDDSNKSTEMLKPEFKTLKEFEDKLESVNNNDTISVGEESDNDIKQKKLSNFYG